MFKFVFVKVPAFVILGIAFAAAATQYGFWIKEGTSTLSDPMPWILSGLLVFAAPAAWAKFMDSKRRARWEREAALDRARRGDAEEEAHRTALRRERERLEMQMEMRVKELMATLEAQHAMDAAKLRQLQDMKREFAGRQNADLATLLGRLEAMKGAQP